MLEGSSMLLNVLALIIAFSAVMLLLSLLVTSLSQTTQAILRLRARNLEHAVTRLLEMELDVHTRSRSRDCAARLLNSPDLALLDRRSDPNSLLSRFRGPQVSWVDPSVMREVLHKSQEDSAPPGEGKREGVIPSSVNVERVAQRFDRVEPAMSKRFAKIMRGISLAWAVVVAVVFQVSTPALVQRLSTDPAYRARVEGQASAIIEGSRVVLTAPKDAAEVAFEHLIERRPELATLRNGVDTLDRHPEATEERLAELLENHADRSAILADYDRLLEEALQAEVDQGIARTKATAQQLAAIDITPWQHDTRFYFDNGSAQFVNILGVLTTAILLTLGAPFWFRVVKQSMGLRDLLAPPERKNDKAPPAPKTAPPVLQEGAG